MQPLSTASARKGTFFVVAGLLLAVAAVPRFYAAWVDQGIFWPDEIFQSVEEAHRLIFGYGITPWEYRAGARSWVFPGMVAVLLKAGSLVGLDSGRALVLLVKTTMALLSLGALYMTMLLARSLAGTRGALLAGLFGGFYPASLLLSSRCLSEVATVPVLLGSYLLARAPGRERQLLAGALAGLAICMRYQNGVIACGVLAIVISERRFADAAWFAAGASTLGLMGGLLDWLTWGTPFYAFKKYLYFNLKKSGARFGRYPFSYYATVTWSAVGPTALLLGFGLIASVRLAPKLFLLVLGYCLLHALIPHKEYRFLMPIFPFALALAGAGLADALGRLPASRTLIPFVGVASALAMLYRTTQLTWEKMGFPSDRGDRSPWHSGEGINRLLWAAGSRDDVCGLMVTGESFGWIGGYSYFHRDANLFPGTSEAEQRAANYLIAPADAPPLPGYVALDRSRESRLFKRAGGCDAPAPEYRRELP